MDNAPRLIHQQGQLLHVRFVVGRFLVAHPGNDDDPVVHDDRDAHMPADGKMTAGVTLRGRLVPIVVVHHRPPLPDAVGPDARRFQRVMMVFPGFTHIKDIPAP